MSFSVDEILLVKCLRQAYPNSGEILIKKFDYKPSAITPGSNYTSEIFSVSVEFECDGKLQEEFIIFKVPYIHKLYKQMKKAGFYEKENHMYSSIIPKLQEISSLSMLPKHYMITELHVLALEDLTKRGYLLKDEVQWNLKQSVLLLSELAKFHAASVKLHQKNPSLLKPASGATLFREDVVVAIKNRVYPYLMPILKAEKVNERVIQKFAEYNHQIDHKSIFEIANRLRQFQVLNHGNLKSNNLLLKYESGRPVSIKIIDYQTYFWHSPIFDLLFFFILVIDYDVFEQHNDELIDMYLNTLNDNLQNVGCNCTYLKEAYNADFEGSKFFAMFTLLFSSMKVIRKCIPKFLHGDPANEPSQEDVETIRKSELFDSRFSKWFRYFQKRGYFD